MRTLLFLILLAACTVGEAHAISVRQHSLRGMVASVDAKRGIVTITTGDKEAPTEFVVVGKHTRVRHNGAPATLEELTVGQAIKVYYTQEVGKSVAHEISWKTPKAP